MIKLQPMYNFMENVITAEYDDATKYVLCAYGLHHEFVMAT
jgi:hypothetical protein